MHQPNPFIKQSLHHAQMLMSESNRAVSNSQSLTMICNDIISAAQSGNIQGVVIAAENARNLANQVAGSTQMLNQALNNHFDRVSFVVGKIQGRINELANAIQSARSGACSNNMTMNNQSNQYQNQYFQPNWHSQH